MTTPLGPQLTLRAGPSSSLWGSLPSTSIVYNQKSCGKGCPALLAKTICWLSGVQPKTVVAAPKKVNLVAGPPALANVDRAFTARAESDAVVLVLRRDAPAAAALELPVLEDGVPGLVVGDDLLFFFGGDLALALQASDDAVSRL